MTTSPEFTAEQARRLIAAAAGHNINPVMGPQTIGEILGLGMQALDGALSKHLPGTQAPTSTAL
jgi:hypothetical protein